MEELSEQSRVWIYQADRNLTGDELVKISDILEKFCKDWTAHNKLLKAGFLIEYDRFIVLIVDESMNDASGCSIDKSVHTIRQTGADLGIDFFKRTEMGYLSENKVKTISFHDIVPAYQSGVITESTPFFDTRVASLGEFRKSFIKPLGSHWLAGYLKTSNAN